MTICPQKQVIVQKNGNQPIMCKVKSTGPDSKQLQNGERRRIGGNLNVVKTVAAATGVNLLSMDPDSDRVRTVSGFSKGNRRKLSSQRQLCQGQ